MVDTNAGAEAEKRSGRRLRKVALVAVPVLVVAAGAAVFLWGGGDEAAAATPTTVAVLSDEEGDVIDVDTMTVNLVGEEGRYARVGFAVVLSVEADASAVGAKVPLMRDAAITTLTRYDSATLQSPDGIQDLRADLSDAMRALFPDGSVIRAVLTEVIVQ